MTERTIRAYGDKIAVVPIEEDTVSAAGLILVRGEDSHEKWMRADVVSVGNDVEEDLAEGDVVVMDYWAGAEYEGVVYVPQSAILARICDGEGRDVRVRS